jgi:hypothetical protein
MMRDMKKSMDAERSTSGIRHISFGLVEKIAGLIALNTPVTVTGDTLGAFDLSDFYGKKK